MFSLSKKTDYALLSLSYLMQMEPRRVANTKEIAEKYAIPVELLAKILQKLAKAELLVSTPGPTGGYRLARSPAEISVGCVVEIIDGPPAIIHCLKTVSPSCDQHERCTIRDPLVRINAKIFHILKHTSLAEVFAEEASAASERAIPVRMDLHYRELEESKR